MEERRRYTRVAVKDIPPAPRNGCYVTSADAKAYCVLVGAMFAFFSALVLFGRRGGKA